jgi:hypothetical protein
LRPAGHFRERAGWPEALLLPYPALTQGTAPPLQPRAEADALLSQIMARLHGVKSPVIQFVPASHEPADCPVAYDFAIACAARLGRTLLLSASDPQAVAPSQGDDAAPSDVQGPAAESHKFLPDANGPRLFHAAHPAPDQAAAEIARLRASPREFAALIAASPPPGYSPGTIALACHGNGTVVTVAAGKTPLTDVLATAQLLRTAGASVLGTVLYRCRVSHPEIRSPRWR